MNEYRDNHCQCLCHYFPGMIQHVNPCCKAEDLFEQLHGEKKDSVSKLERFKARLESGAHRKV